MYMPTNNNGAILGGGGTVGSRMPEIEWGTLLIISFRPILIQ
jgi:hypothetical protein